MDACNVAAIVNLDGMWGDELEANLDRYDRAHPGRFVDVRAPGLARDGSSPGFGERMAALAARRGRSRRARAEGLEGPRAASSATTAPAARAARRRAARAGLGRRRPTLGVPVTIHVADPIAFFDPLDERNERLEELLANPDWWFGDRDRFPTFERAHRVARGARRAPPADDLHRRARGLRRRGPRVGRADARHLPEPARGHRGAHRGARPAAAGGARADRAPSRSVRCSAPTCSRRTGRSTRCTSGSWRRPTSTSPTTRIPTKCRAKAAGRSAASSYRPMCSSGVYRTNAKRLLV